MTGRMNADGSGQTNLTDDPAAGSFKPSWSPDSTRIAFSRNENGTEADIYAMNADGTGRENLSNTGADERHPAWSPDGMEVDVTVPDDTVGSVNGDLNSRRGRLQGMEPTAGMTRIKAEVPMAEMLTYGQALTSMTGGRGDYHMQFLRYDEVPSHVAQKLIEDSKKEQEEAKV